MGMTIEEQELVITYLQEMLSTYVEGHGYEAHPLPEYYAIEKAIDTMRKYQKIRQILKDIPYGGDATVRRIQEVIEDGNNN